MDQIIDGIKSFGDRLSFPVGDFKFDAYALQLTHEVPVSAATRASPDSGSGIGVDELDVGGGRLASTEKCGLP